VLRHFNADGGNGIAFGVPVGLAPAFNQRIELENPPASAGNFFMPSAY